MQAFFLFFWLLVGFEENKKFALDMYNEIYKKTPKYDYKVYINKMKKS